MTIALMPPGAPPRAFPLTDIGNGERLIARHGEDLRYVPAWGKWLVWRGTHWGLDETLIVQRMAKDTVRAMWEEARALPDGSDRKRDLAMHAIRSEADGKIKAMLARAQAEPGVAVTPAQLDADPWRLTVRNGVVDLRTGRLSRHERGHLSTKCVPADFDPEARCDRWEAFLWRVLGGSQELVTFVQRAVGYSLTALTREQCLFFLYGAGANGKSTFLEVLRALFGEYATQADFTTFLERKGDGPRNDIARLFGARVVTSSEVGEGKRLNESLIKTLTGTDTVAARYLYAETFEFRPTFKLWLAANHRPVIRGTDAAIWRRIHLVPFTVQIPEAERDPDLGEALRQELDGILAWAVAGCLLWLEHGLGVPAAVRDATGAYRRDSDTLGAFLEDCCVIDADAAVPAFDLYHAYGKWADEGGEYKLSQTAFGRQLEERGFAAEKRGRGNDRVKWRTGLRLTQSATAASLNGDKATSWRDR